MLTRTRRLPNRRRRRPSLEGLESRLVLSSDPGVVPVQVAEVQPPPADQIAFLYEVESGVGDGQVMHRGGATGEGDAHRTRKLWPGQAVTIPILITTPGDYTVSVRYSRDNPAAGSVPVSVLLDGEPVGSFVPAN